MRRLSPSLFPWLLCMSMGLTSARTAAARMILISFDGLRPDAIDAANTPNLRALIAAGSYTPLALCDLPSATLPNHTTMLTGLTADRHGVFFNTEVDGKIGVPTIIDGIAGAGLRTGFYASKSKLAFLAHEESLDVFEMRGTLAELVDLIVQQIASDPLDFIFLHSREPDSTGHQFGWMTPEYLAAVEMADEQLGRILDVIEDAGLTDVNVLITADHGGDGMTHIFNTEEVRRIPWIACGPDIAAGRTLCGPVVQQDMAATVLALMGLPVPEEYEGEPVAEAFRSMPQTPCESAAPFLGPPCMILMIPAAGLVVAWLWWGRRRRVPGAGQNGSPASV